VSVQEFLAFQDRIYAELLNPPECWFLLANTFGRAEANDVVALFDTEELCKAYVEASKLPEGWFADIAGGSPRLDGFFRSYRPDSLLWDYNPLYEGMVWPVRIRNILDRGHAGLPANPAPPSRPVAEIITELKARVAEQMLRDSNPEGVG